MYNELNNLNSNYAQVVTEEKINFIETGNPDEEDLNEIINDGKADNAPVNQYEIVNPDETETIVETIKAESEC